MTDNNFKWVNDIPPPLPGMCYIEPSLNVDFKEHDDSLESFLPPTIYTDPIELLDIDYMKIVLDDFCGFVEDSDKKKKKVYEKEYDFDSYIIDSFDSVNDFEHPIDKNIKVKNVYDMFNGNDEKYCLIQSDDVEIDGQLFTIQDFSQSNLHKYLVNEKGLKLYEGIRFTNNDYMLCKIEDDKFFYYDVVCVLKYKKCLDNVNN